MGTRTQPMGHGACGLEPFGHPINPIKLKKWDPIWFYKRSVTDPGFNWGPLPLNEVHPTRWGSPRVQD